MYLSVVTVQPVAQPVSELVQLQSAAVSSEPEPVSNISLPPQPTPSVVSSASVMPGQEADATSPVTLEVASAPASETRQAAMSLPSQLRSSKRSTQRAAKSSHKSGSVSGGLLLVLALRGAGLVDFQQVYLYV